MNLNGRRESSNVSDQRGRRGVGRGLKLGGGIGAVIIAAIIAWVSGGNPLDIITSNAGQMLGGGGMTETSQEYTPTAQEEELAEFSRKILAGTEDVWTKLFEQQGLEYEAPTLVLFTDAVTSGCGNASASMGPFYCSADEKLYIDLSFFSEMRQTLGADGDFAIELQADYYAGVWAHHDNAMFGSLEPGDIEEAIDAAQKIGDDYLQKRAQGYAVPDSFTHGTSEQRMQALNSGLRTGQFPQR